MGHKSLIIYKKNKNLKKLLTPILIECSHTVVEQWQQYEFYTNQKAQIEKGIKQKT